MRSRHDDSEVETATHPCMPKMWARYVWLCKNEDTTKVWEKSIQILQEWMTKQNTQPDLQTLLSNEYTNGTTRNHGHNLYHPTLD